MLKETEKIVDEFIKRKIMGSAEKKNETILSDLSSIIVEELNHYFRFLETGTEVLKAKCIVDKVFRNYKIKEDKVL